jgi:hypothetical protein
VAYTYTAELGGLGQVHGAAVLQLELPPPLAVLVHIHIGYIG